MKQKFFTTTAQSNFIKNLLLNTALPLYNSVKDDTFIIKGNVYVYKNSLIRCTKTGLFNPENNVIELMPTMTFNYDDQHTVTMTLDYPYSGIFNNIMSMVGKVITIKCYNGNTPITEKLYPTNIGEFPRWEGSHIILYRPEEMGDVAQVLILTSTLNAVQKGDVNLDGVVDNKDIELVQEYIRKQDSDDPVVLSDLAFTAGDINNSGEINTTDVTQIRRIISGARQPSYFNFIMMEENTNDNAEIAEIEILNSNFYFGRWYLKHTQIFESNQLSYDSDTHKYLGEYLRFYRDIFNTDLMPFYNCFNGVYTTKYFITTETDGGGLQYGVKQSNYDFYQQGNSALSNKYHTKEAFKVLSVPIKLNKKYTIAIDCDSQVLIAPAFISSGKLLEMNFGGYKLNLTSAFNKVFAYNHLIFNQPVVVDIDNRDESMVKDHYSEIVFQNRQDVTMCELFQKYEKNLFLLIQIPTENDSSVVVLEGDYTNLSTDKHFNVECLQQDLYQDTFLSMAYPSQSFLDSVLLSNLSLIQLNDSNRYPFADRLIEYLLWNVIDENDEIADNVSKTQLYLGVNTDVHPMGVFDDYLRVVAFNTFKSSPKYTDLDINGNIDKDMEKYLFG